MLFLTSLLSKKNGNMYKINDIFDVYYFTSILTSLLLVFVFDEWSVAMGLAIVTIVGIAVLIVTISLIALCWQFFCKQLSLTRDRRCKWRFFFLLWMYFLYSWMTYLTQPGCIFITSVWYRWPKNPESCFVKIYIERSLWHFTY